MAEQCQCECHIPGRADNLLTGLSVLCAKFAEDFRLPFTVAIMCKRCSEFQTFDEQFAHSIKGGKVR